MFYDLSEPIPFAHDPSKAFVGPRPIAWVGTRAITGDNLAAFSFFTMISAKPMLLAFSVSPDVRDGSQEKDTLSNIRETGVFSISIPSKKHLEAVAVTGTSAPRGVDEFSLANVAKAECRRIDVPRVGDAAASVECESQD